MNATVSIIVPVYNAETTIERCILSILGQTYKDIEVILINDGSSDNSFSLCKALAEKDNRISIINQDNSGVSVARNKGISASTGLYIMFVDADDTIASKMVEEMMKLQMENNTSIALCNYYEVLENETSFFINQLGSSQDTVVPAVSVIERIVSISDDFISGCCWRILYKKTLITDNNIWFTPGLTMSEDFQFVLKCLRNTSNVVLAHEGYYYYTKNSNSTTSKYMPKQEEDMATVNKWLQNYSEMFPDNENIKTGVNICIANTLLINAVNLCRKGTPYSITERASHLKSLCSNNLYKSALSKALKFKKQIPKKMYLELLLLKHKLYLFDILHHSRKSGTLK